MIQLLCDKADCGQIIQDGTERFDISLPARRDEVSRQNVPGARFFFHPACYTANGPVTPLPGVSVTVTHVPAAASSSPAAPTGAGAPAA